ncbi:MAG TPA: hypothetical protein PL001_09530 [Candidatus Kryptobacter bacterium]|nr:hypothetical protein [Candidatus Kryptobacter bacterium]
MNDTNQIEEIYPMPSFVTLRISDPVKYRKWYEEGLGFRVRRIRVCRKEKA